MSKVKNMASHIYEEHLKGAFTKFRSDPEATRQAMIENMLFRELVELSVNRFKWEGLPNSVDVRHLELTLLHNALAVFYFEEKYDKFLALKGTAVGRNDYQDNPVMFNVHGNGLIDRRLTTQECVPIWANYTRSSDMDIISIYANKLAQIDRTIEINIDNARTAKLIVATETQQLSAENIHREIQSGHGVIRVRPELQEAIQVFDLGVNVDVIEKTHITRVRIWNECMGLLGIENANQDKKERLVADEVHANSEQVALMRAVNLNARKTAADQINRKYGLAVTVEYNHDISEQLNNVDDEPLTGLPDEYRQFTEPTKDLN